MGRLVLITGGVRSGKSDYAEALAHQLGGDDVLFMATAEAGDAEMARRIAAHQQSRPAAWQTLETPCDVGAALTQHVGQASVVLIDCLTLLVSNVMFALGEEPEAEQAERAVQTEVQALLQACQSVSATCLIVSNEVGLGLVPETRLGRLYRDLLGRANQVLAAQAQTVYFMVAGLAVDIKALAAPRNGCRGS